MNKQELIEAISSKTGASKALTGEILDALLETIKKSVSKGNPVQLVDFGSYTLGKRAARTGRNPKTGESIRIAACKTLPPPLISAFGRWIVKISLRVCPACWPIPIPCI